MALPRPPRAIQTFPSTLALEATAFLAQANGGFNATHSKPLDDPMTTVTNTGSQQQLVPISNSTARNASIAWTLSEVQEWVEKRKQMCRDAA